jgi:hypothetical protein
MRSRFTLRVLGSAILAVASACVPRIASAATNVLSEATKYEFPDPFQGASIPAIMGSIISAMLSLVGALFFVMFLWGGFGYLTAGGDSQKVQKSQKALTNAVIGLVIVAASYAIVYNIIGLIQRGATGS